MMLGLLDLQRIMRNVKARNRDKAKKYVYASALGFFCLITTLHLLFGDVAAWVPVLLTQIVLVLFSAFILITLHEFEDRSGGYEGPDLERMLNPLFGLEKFFRLVHILGIIRVQAYNSCSLCTTLGFIKWRRLTQCHSIEISRASQGNPISVLYLMYAVSHCWWWTWFWRYCGSLGDLSHVSHNTQKKEKQSWKERHTPPASIGWYFLDLFHVTPFKRKMSIVISIALLFFLGGVVVKMSFFLGTKKKQQFSFRQNLEFAALVPFFF